MRHLIPSSTLLHAAVLGDVAASGGMGLVLLLLLGLAAPNGLGTAFVLLQAVAVLGFGLLQWVGLRHGAVLGAVAA